MLQSHCWTILNQQYQTLGFCRSTCCIHTALVAPESSTTQETSDGRSNRDSFEKKSDISYRNILLWNTVSQLRILEQRSFALVSMDSTCSLQLSWINSNRKHKWSNHSYLRTNKSNYFVTLIDVRVWFFVIRIHLSLYTSTPVFLKISSVSNRKMSAKNLTNFEHKESYKIVYKDSCQILSDRLRFLW